MSQNQSNRVHNRKLEHHQSQTKAKVVCSDGKLMMIFFSFFMKKVFYIKATLLQQCTTMKWEKSSLIQKKNALTKRLKKFFCIMTMLAQMLYTMSPNFWRNEASEPFHTLHIVKISSYATSDFSFDYIYNY